MSDDSWTIWLCTDCAYLLANAEELPDRPADQPAPLSKLDGEDATPGMRAEEHDCGWTGGPREDECECEVQHFGTGWCDGCGTHLAGERHAATSWALPVTE